MEISVIHQTDGNPRRCSKVAVEGCERPSSPPDSFQHDSTVNKMQLLKVDFPSSCITTQSASKVLPTPPTAKTKPAWRPGVFAFTLTLTELITAKLGPSIPEAQRCYRILATRVQQTGFHVQRDACSKAARRTFRTSGSDPDAKQRTDPKGGVRGAPALPFCFMWMKSCFLDFTGELRGCS